MKIRKILSFMLCLAMLLAFLPAIAPTASAATTKTIYFKPNSSYWDQADAWFQAWVWGSTQADAWYTFVHADYNGIYKIEVPSDATGMKIIRRGPSHTSGSWDSGQMWNSTGDLTISTKNCFSMTSWDGGSWSTISSVAEPTFTVAGAAGLCGSEWVPTDSANDMTLNADGLYEKVFTNVAAGTYEFKVLANHAWTYSWGLNGGSSNASVTVAEAGSTVTILFNESTKAITTKVEVPVVIPDLKFSAASLEVGEGISINFKADAALFADGLYTAPSATFVFNKGTENERTFTADSYIVSEDKYVFQLKNIRPDWMGDTVTATLTATLDGESVFSDPMEYSVATYCYNKLDDSASSDQLKTLAADILNYGAATQQYTGYNTSALVNADLSQYGVAGTAARTLNDHTAIGTDVAQTLATWKSASLNLREIVRMRIRFTTTEDITGWTVNVTGAVTTTLTPTASGSNIYTVFVDSLKVSQMSDTVIFQIFDANGNPVSNKLTYSIESYAAVASGDKLVNVMDYMMRYGDAVTAYAN